MMLDFLSGQKAGVLHFSISFLFEKHRAFFDDPSMAVHLRPRVVGL